MIKDVLILQKREFRNKVTEKYINRKLDLKKLNAPLIKVIVGPRRAGKSFFALHFLSELDGFGYVNFDDNWRSIVPLTFELMMKRCQFHNATFVKGEWKGLPNSSVDYFKSISWTPSKPDLKQLSWDTGLNYVQYYDMTRTHFADIISVYPYHTSLLSSDLFACYIVYLKHIIRTVWAEYVGVEMLFQLL